MRIVFIGTGKVSIETAKELIRKGHEVVIIEIDKDMIDELSEELDCSFLHGDGSLPNILHEVNPGETDFLFCLTNSDQVNLIASLVGRSLGFVRIVTSIGDPQFETICHELGLKDTINPSRTISRFLVDMAGGGEIIELSTVIKDEARFFTLIATEKDAVAAKDLKLPAEAKVICYYRDGKFSHADEKTEFCFGDEIVILTHSKNMPVLEERWQPKPVPEELQSKE
ncbi:K+ transport system, NAD-binding component [Desulfocapsa sulfexigens DSM 10523]|uniref:K+ transport system, NAD-binding component n=1 Tax=Desulfocapsa sulfexigens (strain DSM 10523 / SB164P1) TaxID=1167006 RepID=M1P778_DESSD|nr:TrkA family potassium uptake protein [Desulfocapsa sulfexigens]AGF77542.1 K+ transport system, NAD-binding component [Desulfocapsa sulfexigens DSM 10523]